jgi:hypothetical protein
VPSEDPPRGGIAGFAREHPGVASVIALCLVLGAVLGPLLLPPEFAFWRRELGGVAAGGGLALLLTYPRLF